MSGSEEVPMSREKSKTLIIGIGNPYRNDDAVGVIVARRLKQKLGDRIAVLEQIGEGAALIEAWHSAEAVIIIDAVVSGAGSGTVHRFDVHAQTLPKGFLCYSTHAFGLAEAIEVARTLNQLPPRLVVYGIEGKVFTAGTELSREVERAAGEVLNRVLAEMKPSAAESDG